MASQSQPQTGTRLPPQSGPSMPTTATKQDIEALLAGPVLDHLAPISGGRWKLVSQQANNIVVAYRVNGREVFTTTVEMGANPDTVNDTCWQFVYGYPSGVPLLPDGVLQEWTPPVTNVRIPPQDFGSMSQIYNQMLDANEIMATGAAPIRQGDTFPAPADVQLPEADDFSISMLDQAQAQVHDDALMSGMESFQNTQSANMAGFEPDDYTAFQNMDDLAPGGPNPFMFPGGTGDEADASPH
ncbi:hypothetical protein HYE68_000911 [Fusarium pseudograminearum]|nr:hypothetical protein HYE68_000911 [Fusarium pseudograminearum]